MTTIYGQPACVQCKLTENYLIREAIPFVKIDVTEDEEAYEYITKELGYFAAPVVVTEEGEHWSGFRPDKLALCI